MYYELVIPSYPSKRYLFSNLTFIAVCLFEMTLFFFRLLYTDDYSATHTLPFNSSRNLFFLDILFSFPQSSAWRISCPALPQECILLIPR